MTVQQTIGLNVRHRRLEHHWTARQLADWIGWQADYLSRFEHGKWGCVHPEKLQALAQYLRVSIDSLYAPVPEEEAPVPALSAEEVGHGAS